ncbi:MAG: CoA transferase [Pseudomonadota bacterium]|nr:CoA transferase [Pseudomonadota bacterium]
MSNLDKDPGPLDGVKVLDFSMFLAGPYGGRLLSDHGAEVIKIEPPGGETIRRAHPVIGGKSRYFAQLNAGKKCIVLDLKTEDGKEIVRRLALKADVVLENFRPGVMERLGLGYEALSEINPRLIYCAISGYGPTGPNSTRPAFAPIVHAHAGYDMAVFEYARVVDQPLSNRSTAADILASAHSFGAISAALFGREKTGRGDRIDVTLEGVMHNLLYVEIQNAQLEDPVEPLVYTPVRAKDGFLMVVPVSDANLRAMAKAASRNWDKDPRYNTVGERWKHWDDLLAELEEWSLGHTAAEAEKLLLEAGCPATRFRTVNEVVEDESLRETGGLIEIDEGTGPYLIVSTPTRFKNREVGPGRSVDPIDSSREYVLREYGGN